MLKILGITGPTGAGKTTFLRRVEARGGCVLDLDAIYHELLEKDPELRGALDARYPGVIQNGVLDRKALGRIVFGDPAALEDLNRITGAFILAETDRRLGEAEERKMPLAAIDAINLLEGELPERCEATIAIVAPPELRIRRIMARDGISEEYARLRVDAQKPNEYYAARCGYTLVNDADTEEAFAAQCDALLDMILDQSASSGRPEKEG